MYAKLRGLGPASHQLHRIAGKSLAVQTSARKATSYNSLELARHATVVSYGLSSECFVNEEAVKAEKARLKGIYEHIFRASGNVLQYVNDNLSPWERHFVCHIEGSVKLGTRIISFLVRKLHIDH